MILINGSPAQSIPATDRGLAYGDGVFRTLRAHRGEPLHWARHYAKLAHDCGALALPCPEAEMLLKEVHTVANDDRDAVVKLTVTRGSSARGYAPPQPCVVTRVVNGSAYAPATVPATGVTVRLCQLRLARQPALAGVKHLNRLENVLARAEWADPDIHEGLLLDYDGWVIGGTMSNLFIVEADALITPALAHCGVAGVTRDRVMALSAQRGIACRVEAIPLQRVLGADEVFLVNSLIGLWPVAQLGERGWPAGRLSEDLQHALEMEDGALV